MTNKKTFPIDNQIIQWAPKIFALQKRPTTQPYLPGFEKPLPPFAEWVVYGLYALIDPNNPSKPILTTPTEILEILDFARDLSHALGDTTTYSSDQYELINESLDLLFTTEIYQTGYWKTYVPAGQTSKGKKKTGKYAYTFRGHILSNYTFIYPENVTPAELLPDGEKINISKAKYQDRAIWKRKEGPRPIGIELQLDPRLIRGLTGETPNIGATTVPFKIFELRKAFPKNQTLKRLLFYVLRQANQTMSNQDLDKLVKQLDLDSRRKAKTRKDIIQGFELLKNSGVIKAYKVTEADTSGKAKITFTKSPDWYLDDQDRISRDVLEGEE